jgi:hypothetical protein
VFDSTQFPWAGAEEFQSKNLPRTHFVPLLPPDERRAASEQHRVEIQQFDQQIAQLEQSLPTLPEADQQPTREQLAALQRQRSVAHRRGYSGNVPAAYAVSEGSPHDVAVQVAGDPMQPGKVVPRGAIACLAPAPLPIPPDASGRLQLAEWITRPDHPLTARVIVNRLWQHHFGRGIVATASNFGTSGARPTHPELLDYLAGQLVAKGWRLKPIQRLMLTSRAWRLSSQIDERALARDPGNEQLARQHRRRLDAEALRDAWLAVSGRLDLQRPGPHPFPPLEQWGWSQHHPFKEQYASNHRSVYLMTQRLQRHPFLALFDGPDANTSTDVRTSATVPTQALYLLNSPELAELAGAFAERLEADRPTDPERLSWAWELCCARPATAAEVEHGRQYLAQAQARLGDAPEARRLGWRSYCRTLLVSNAFLYID